jgi:hypothetical protein
MSETLLMLGANTCPNPGTWLQPRRRRWKYGPGLRRCGARTLLADVAQEILHARNLDDTFAAEGLE